MAINAKITTLSVTDAPVIDRTHPPVVLTVGAKPANGVLSRGLILTRDASGLLVAYDRAAQTPGVIAGVLAENIDTSKDTAAVVLVHGTVVASALKHKDTAATAADITALASVGIYAV